MDIFEREVRAPMPERSDGLAAWHHWDNYVECAGELLNGQWKWEGYPSIYRPGWMEMQHPPAPTIYLHRDDPFPTVLWHDAATQQIVMCKGYPTEWRARLAPWDPDRQPAADVVTPALDAAFYGLAQWLSKGAPCCHWFQSPNGWGGKLSGSDQQNDDLPAGGALSPEVALNGPDCPPLLAVRLNPTAWRARWVGVFGRTPDPVAPTGGVQ